MSSQPLAHTDEIDLKDLLLTLWAGKAIVMVTILLTMLCAAGYLWLTPAIYRASVTVVAPAEEDVLVLAETQRVLEAVAGGQITANKAVDKAVDTAFKRFTQLAGSSSMQHRFFQGSEFEQANQATIHTPASIIVDSKEGTVTLTLNGNDATMTATSINQYTELLIDTAQEELAEDMNRQIAVLQDSLQGELNSLRQKAVIKRQQTIAKLNEALALAESLDMEEPAAHGNMIINYSGDTAYMRGGKALRNQIKLLEQRESDDDFIPELATIAEHQRRLEGIAFEAGDVQAARIDVPAIAPRAPIKPRKKLIIAVSVILGGMLGVFIVLIRRAFTD